MPTFTATPPKICDKAAVLTLFQKNRLDETAQVTATLSPTNTQSPLIKYCDYSLSPDGLWVEFREMDALHGASIEFVQINGGKRWQVLSDTLYREPYYEYLLHVSHWDVNGKYAYVSSSFSLDAVGSVILGFTNDLFQVNLDSGQVLTVFDGLHDVAFSPNDLYLAYLAWADGYAGDTEFASVNIFDTKSGVIVSSYSISSKYRSVGGIVWSPDSQKIVFTGAVSTWFDAPNVQSSLFLVNLKKGTVQKLIDDQKDLVIPYAWEEADRILVCRMPPEPGPCGNYYYFELRGRMFSSQVTLTPEP